MADLRIDIAAEFKGKKAFQEADSTLTKMNKNVVALGKAFGIALGTKALIGYGKAAVKAFAADEAAARRLATAVDNLGLSFFKADVETFIKNTETSAGVLDDVLRPAMQALLTTTGSLTKSQTLLNNAIQISRATGIDLATVSQDLANGYVGITRGLKKYNTGLTQAELKSKSFNEILGVLLARSAGSAQDYLTTTAYKMDVLNVATENAKETIGAGLVDAFAKLSGGSTATDAAKTIDNIAKSINGITSAAATAAGAVVKLYKGLDYLTSFGGLTGANGSLVGMLSSSPSTNRSKSPAGTAARTAQQRAAEAAAAKRAKELANLTKKQIASQKSLTAEQKKQNALKKAGTVFDIDQIQLIAALKGKLSAEDRKRVEAQLALLNENDVLAAQLTKDILLAQDATGGLYKYFLSIGNTKIANPFGFLDEWILNFQKKLDSLKLPATIAGSSGAIGTTSIQSVVSSNPVIQNTFDKVLEDFVTMGLTEGAASVLALSSARYEALGQPYGVGIEAVTSAVNASQVATNVPATTPSSMVSYNPLSGLSYNPNANAAPIINVTVQGNLIREQQLIDQVMAGTQLSSLSGSPSQIGRIAGMFG